MFWSRPSKSKNGSESESDSPPSRNGEANVLEYFMSHAKELYAMSNNNIPFESILKYSIGNLHDNGYAYSVSFAELSFTPDPQCKRSKATSISIGNGDAHATIVMPRYIKYRLLIKDIFKNYYYDVIKSLYDISVARHYNSIIGIYDSICRETVHGLMGLREIIQDNDEIKVSIGKLNSKIISFVNNVSDLKNKRPPLENKICCVPKMIKELKSSLTLGNANRIGKFELSNNLMKEGIEGVIMCPEACMKLLIFHSISIINNIAEKSKISLRISLSDNNLLINTFAKLKSNDVCTYSFSALKRKMQMDPPMCYAMRTPESLEVSLFIQNIKRMKCTVSVSRKKNAIHLCIRAPIQISDTYIGTGDRNTAIFEHVSSIGLKIYYHKDDDGLSKEFLSSLRQRGAKLAQMKKGNADAKDYFLASHKRFSQSNGAKMRTTIIIHQKRGTRVVRISSSRKYVYINPDNIINYVIQENI